MHEQQNEKLPGGQHKVRIHIDRKPYDALKDAMTGIELRDLAGIPADYDLWREVPGSPEDVIVEDAVVVKLKNGMHFYSCRKTINPGGRHASA